MSNFSQVHELLLHNQQLHQRNGHFYTELSSSFKSERIKQLLSTLVMQETELSSSLKAYFEKALGKFLNSYFRFDHKTNVEDLFITQFDLKTVGFKHAKKLATGFDE